jgi:hypothetical protein
MSEGRRLIKTLRVICFSKREVNVKTFESVPPKRRGWLTPLEPRFYRGFLMQFALLPQLTP